MRQITFRITTVAAVALAIMVGAAVVVARKYNLILTQWK